ncbi:MAG: c-type cytochrome, partial [Sphingobacterium sp.]
VHGRIYRMTYPSRPLVKPAKIDGATIEELLSNLKLKEYRTRYRTRSELRMRDANEVASKVKTWVKGLDSTDPNYEHYLTEALWVTWGGNKIDKSLLEQLLTAKDFRARSAAVHALRYNTDKMDNYADLFKKAAKDPQGRVKLEVIAASSWLNNQVGLAILKEIDKSTLDEWNKPAYETALAHLNNKSVQTPEKTSKLTTNLKGEDLEQFKRGAVLYERDGYCITCHQPNGAGLEISGFPPLNKSPWVLGNQDRLIKLTLNGLMGPLEVGGKKYPGQVPMTPFGGLLNDQELADVLTFVRNSFGNKGSVISADKVKEIRESIKDKKGFYSPDELLEAHPME